MSPKVQEIASRLKDARLRLEFAQSYVKEALTDGLGGSDGFYAYRHAVRAETEALRKYTVIMREYEECLRREMERSKEQGA